VQSANEIAQRPGVIFYRDRGHHSISGGVDDRDVVAEKVGNIGTGAVRGNRHSVRGISYRNGGHHNISGDVAIFIVVLSIASTD
jgi:hypothetical protein